MEQALPTCVIAKDGTREPFEADRISQSLFAMTETLGNPNAFLARELADGVLHFLALEALGEAVRSEQIAEVVAKVVRELGQPTLARAFEQRRPDSAIPLPRVARSDEISIAIPRDLAPKDVVRRSLEEYSLQVAFARDLASAQQEGLIAIDHLEEPRTFAAMLLDVRSAKDDVSVLLEDACRRAGDTLIVEGLEHAWAGATEAEITSWLRQLRCGLRGYGRGLDVHLHVAQAPPWSQELSGPLFAGGSAGQPLDSGIVLERLTQNFAGLLQVCWHGSSQQPIDRGVLQTLQSARQQLGWAVSIQFDRPKRPIALSRGVDRTHPAALGGVRLPLASLLKRPGLSEDSRAFLGKLPSLVRMAVSAGVQKRNYLRRVAEDLGRGFALDRARWLITPCGLDDVVRHYLTQGIAESRASLSLGREMLDLMRGALQEESRRTGLSLALALDLDARSAELGTPEDLARVHVAATDANAIDEMRERPGVSQVVLD